MLAEGLSKTETLAIFMPDLWQHIRHRRISDGTNSLNWTVYNVGQQAYMVAGAYPSMRAHDARVVRASRRCTELVGRFVLDELFRGFAILRMLAAGERCLLGG